MDVDNPRATALLERIRGTLMGLAAGDRIGGPLQFALSLADTGPKFTLNPGPDNAPRFAMNEAFKAWRTDSSNTGR